MLTYTILTLLFGASVLSACNLSSEYVEVSAAEESTRLFSDMSGDVGTALSDGETVTARSVSAAGFTINYDTGDTHAPWSTRKWRHVVLSGTPTKLLRPQLFGKTDKWNGTGSQLQS